MVEHRTHRVSWASAIERKAHVEFEHPSLENLARRNTSLRCTSNFRFR